MTNVAIYARYSSDQQRDASIEDQIRLCEEFAAKSGWRVVERYTDHGISGASLHRPGVQALLQHVNAGRFEIVLTEALDRLSRDQEDIAAVYKRVMFAGGKLHTVSEGAIGTLHVGLKGTMNALFLQDLADKTRRGQRGRIEAGKSGGGNSYGYDVVKRHAEDGDPIRGERAINEEQAHVVRRIFNDYASGRSPKAIARALNQEGIVGPSGSAWGASTIHGHRERGTGILNNQLYVGRMVWNRLRYIKDPQSGKRVSRLNPESAWITKEVPALRIIEQPLWERVKVRQRELESHRFASKADGFWDRRRPRYLFSRLLKCGECDGAYVKVSATHFGCATARNKGTCGNRMTISRAKIEKHVLDGLEHHLMDPELCKVFAAEYVKHFNQLQAQEVNGRKARQAELQKVTRDLDRLVQAIIDGVPGERVKDKVAALEARRAELSRDFGETEAAPVFKHPEMGTHYRRQVTALREALAAGDSRPETTELIRSLVDRIELIPVTKQGKVRLAIKLYGDLAGILQLANEKPAPSEGSGFVLPKATKVGCGGQI